MPTVVTRYLNTGSTTGGDGTTNATTGANRAWPTLEHARSQIIATWPNLVTSDVQIDLICEGATDDTTAVTNTWPTSDATRYIHMQVPVADRTVTFDGNKYAYGRNVNFAAALSIGTNSFRMTGITIYHAGSLNVGGNHGLHITSAGGTWVLEGCKIAKSQNAGQSAILVSAIAGTFVIRNCITGIAIAGGASFGWAGALNFSAIPSNSTVLLYNNTLVANNNGGSAFGISVVFAAAATNAVARIKNNLIQSSPSGITVTNSTTNDQATNVHATTTTASFVSANSNLRLTSADTVARNLGTDLSGVADFPFSIDADQTTRPVGSAWDIGAHEQTDSNVTARLFMAFID